MLADVDAALFLHQFHIEVDQQVIDVPGAHVPEVLLVEQADPAPGKQTSMGDEVGVTGVHEYDDDVLAQGLDLVLSQVVVLGDQGLPLVDQPHILEAGRLRAGLDDLPLAIGQVALGGDVQEGGLDRVDAENLLDLGHEGDDHVLGLQLGLGVAGLDLHKEGLVFDPVFQGRVLELLLHDVLSVAESDHSLGCPDGVPEVGLELSVDTTCTLTTAWSPNRR